MSISYVTNGESGNETVLNRPLKQALAALELDEDNPVPVIRTTTVQIAHADIITLPTTAVELVPTPGAGKIIIPVSAIFSVSDPFVDYTNLGAVADGSRFATVVFGADDLEAMAYFVDDVSPPATAHYTRLFAPSIVGPGIFQLLPLPLLNTYGGGPVLYDPVAVNKALNLYVDNGGDGNFTAGDPANFIRVNVFYMVSTIG